MLNSVAPDEMAHYDHLIGIYTVFKSTYFGPYGRKGFCIYSEASR